MRQSLIHPSRISGADIFTFPKNIITEQSQNKQGLEMKTKSRTFLVLVLVASILATQAILPAHAQVGAVTLEPTDDTYVDSSNPNSNYGAQTYLEILNWIFMSNTYESIVLLKFNLSTVPEGAVVDLATLQIHASEVVETYYVDAYYSSDNSWTESTLTYSTMPAYNTIPLDSITVATAYQSYNLSVVDAVTNALNANPKSVTIVMEDPSSHGSASSVRFYSKESSVSPIDYSPKLIVHWSEVIPEFPMFLLLSLFMIITLFEATYYRKRLIFQSSNQRALTLSPRACACI